MKFRGTAPFALAAAAMLAVGCRSARHATTAVVASRTEAPTPSASTEYSVTNFQATVEGIEASGQMRMAKDSVLWLSVTKFVEIGRAMATPDSVWINAPMLGRNFAGTYVELSRMLGRKVSFAQLQTMLSEDGWEDRVASLVAEMGYDVALKQKQRRRVDALSFPFKK